MGLPSGTLWKDRNETIGDNNFFTYCRARIMFGNELPTSEQFRELIDKCQWSWTGSGYKVTGPNGNHIFLPAAGSRDCDCNIYNPSGRCWKCLEYDANNSYCNGIVFDVGSVGKYWSSESIGSFFHYGLSFSSGGVHLSDYNSYWDWKSVRLVRHEVLQTLRRAIRSLGSKLTGRGFLVEM